MEEKVLRYYKRVEKISNSVIGYAKRIDFSGRKILSIAEEIENVIRALGGKPAWPVNISINETAAHFTPGRDDKTVVNEGDLVKLDIGVHVDGYIWDQAFTICVGSKSHPLIDASNKAVKEAVKLVKPGVKICELSEVIENSIVNSGFSPVRNLTGHFLKRYDIHAKPSIPNVKNTNQLELKAGDVIAIEVFVTDGSGWVRESEPVMIYQYKEDKSVRLPEARKILELAKTKFEKLPFTSRWIKDISPIRVEMALRQLTDAGAVRRYPPLKEESGGLVAQTEVTLIVK